MDGGSWLEERGPQRPPLETHKARRPANGQLPRERETEPPLRSHSPLPCPALPSPALSPPVSPFPSLTLHCIAGPLSLPSSLPSLFPLLPHSSRFIIITISIVVIIAAAFAPPPASSTSSSASLPLHTTLLALHRLLLPFVSVFPNLNSCAARCRLLAPAPQSESECVGLASSHPCAGHGRWNSSRQPKGRLPPLQQALRHPPPLTSRPAPVFSSTTIGAGTLSMLAGRSVRLPRAAAATPSASAC
uniref:Uncharacterized protein n=1 Tax=Physcomitrium patens TaxID=3218 RepID=A0A2K1KQC9_PHYPA|nr:hypothetical protein PHYPA_006877 [Physcomitrium patens]